MNIEAGGQAAIGVYEQGGLMLKKDYKAHVAANRFDLNTLPTCGAKTRAGGSCKHKGNIRNGRCKLHGGKSTGPTIQTYGRNHHRYVHGLRTQEVIAMRKLVAEMSKSLKDRIELI